MPVRKIMRKCLNQLTSNFCGNGCWSVDDLFTFWVKLDHWQRQIGKWKFESVQVTLLVIFSFKFSHWSELLLHLMICLMHNFHMTDVTLFFCVLISLGNVVALMTKLASAADDVEFLSCFALLVVMELLLTNNYSDKIILFLFVCLSVTWLLTDFSDILWPGRTE